MIVNLKELTDEQIAAYLEATKEPPFSVHSLICEIKPLLTDVFLADVKVCRKSIKLFFPNGQEFVIYVKQI